MVTQAASNGEEPLTFEAVLANRRIVRVAVDFEAESLRQLLRLLEDRAC